MKDINYKQLKVHIEEMINLLEYDSMRSAGKCKMNAQTLYYLHQVKKQYNNYKNTPEKEETK